MTAADVCAICEGYAAVTADYPFGPQTRCYRVGGRVFAQVSPDGVDGALRILLADDSIPRDRRVPMVMLRCDPATGDFYRRQYPDSVHRPYHSPPAKQPYANTVLLDGKVPQAAIGDMIDHAYHSVLHRLPKYRQREILAGHGAVDT